MNQFTLDGRIGKDAQVLTTKVGGRQYVRFSLASDIYVNGGVRTDWYDVTCYDPFVINSRSKFLTKGRYVIVSGELNVEKSGDFVNRYLTATTVATPSVGDKKNAESRTVTETTEQVVSVYPRPMAPPTAPEPVTPPQPTIPESVAAPDYSFAGVGATDDGDDLPF